MSNPTITVYERTTSYCGMCKATFLKLDALGLEYQTRALEDQPDEWVKAHQAAGRMQAPIVVAEYESGGSIEISGFRPDLLGSLEVK